ncbi:MAG: hypothetical protein LBO00_01775 [Zoogloeaceae bacterium]|jgi:hypothetical protein|nr:hypothetical protein [Zoogloeaceae bacterium]
MNIVLVYLLVVIFCWRVFGPRLHTIRRWLLIHRVRRNLGVTWQHARRIVDGRIP